MTKQLSPASTIEFLKQQLIQSRNEKKLLSARLDNMEAITQFQILYYSLIYTFFYVKRPNWQGLRDSGNYHPLHHSVKETEKLP